VLSGIGVRFVDEDVLNWYYCAVGRAMEFRRMKNKWHLGMVVHTASPLVFRQTQNKNIDFCFILSGLMSCVSLSAFLLLDIFGISNSQ